MNFLASMARKIHPLAANANAIPVSQMLVAKLNVPVKGSAMFRKRALVTLDLKELYVKFLTVQASRTAKIEESVHENKISQCVFAIQDLKALTVPLWCVQALLPALETVTAYS